MTTNTLYFGKCHSNYVKTETHNGSDYLAIAAYVTRTGNGKSHKEAILNLIKNIRDTADEIEKAYNTCY